MVTLHPTPDGTSALTVWCKGQNGIPVRPESGLKPA